MSAANNTHGAGCILWPIGIYLVVDWSPSETKQYKVAHEMLTTHQPAPPAVTP